MKYIDIHTHKINSDEDILAICNGSDRYMSVGIHPWDITKGYDLSEIKKALEQINVLALGEIGLDSSIKTSIDLQQSVFISQLELNKDINKPVIIHNVKNLSALQIIKKRFPHQFWIIHGFNKSFEMAQQLIDIGCYLSFGANLLESGSSAQAVFVDLPLDAVFFETDNQSQYDIVAIYNKAAQLKKISLNELQIQIIKNFKNIFRGNFCGLE